MCKCNNYIKLPFWETLRRSYFHAFTNLGNYFKLSVIWLLILIYEASTGFSLICVVEGGECRETSSMSIPLILMSLATVAISVSYARNIVLREKITLCQLKFGLKEILYWVYNFIITLFIVIPSVAVILLIGSLMIYKELPEDYMNYLILIPLAFSIYFSRFALVFTAVALNNKEVRLKKSFQITCGNANKIFWGQCLARIPSTLLIAILSIVYQIYGAETASEKAFYVGGIILISCLDSFLKTSFYTHVYQYFMYFYKRQSVAVEVNEIVIEKIIMTEARKEPVKEVVAVAKAAELKKVEPKLEPKKAPAKKVVAKKAPAKKPAAKKAPAKTAAVKKAPAKKVVVKKAPAKKPAAKKAPAKKK